MTMTTFARHTESIAEAGETLVGIAMDVGFLYPFPMAIDTTPTKDGPDLLIQGMPAIDGLQRFGRKSLRRMALSAHAQLSLTAASRRLAGALFALEQDARALPGWVGGDALGLHTRLLFGIPSTCTSRDDGIFGFITLETASLCPVMGSKASEVSDPFRDTCMRLGQMLDHVAARTRHWHPDGLATWHVRDARHPITRPGPVREVFAPSEEAALEADTWWHFQPPLYAVAERLPARRAVCIRAHAMAL